MTDDDKMTPEEIVADIIWDHFGDCNMIYKRHLEQAEGETSWVEAAEKANR